MVRLYFALLLTCAGASLFARAQITVTIDVEEAVAVHAALLNPQLTLPEALLIAELPGSQGLIRKAQSYERPASNALFAQALVAAAHHDTSYQDASQFHFSAVRDHAAQTAAVLAMLQNGALHLLPDAQARIALFTPVGLQARLQDTWSWVALRMASR